MTPLHAEGTIEKQQINNLHVKRFKSEELLCQYFFAKFVVVHMRLTKYLFSSIQELNIEL